jgi:glycerol-3-phosphate dehydrogenase subunit C
MSDVLGDLMRGSLDHCVKCTICETYCPVSNVTPLFPGPKYVGPQAERFRVRDEESPDASLDYCSGCGVCTQVCPQGVHIAEINTQARAKLRERTGFKLRDRLLARPDVIGTLSTPVAPVVNFTLKAKPLRAIGEKTVGLDRRAALPSYPGRTFQRWARKHTSPPGARRVAYFHGCGANWSEPGGRRPSSCSSGSAARSTCRAASAAAGCRRSRTGCSISRAATRGGWRARWRRPRARASTSSAPRRAAR